MDLNKEINAATDKFIAEKLPEMVEQKVTKMIDEVLNDVFRNYSDTAKNIKAKIEEKLDVNLQKFDLVDYNHLVSKAINDSLLKQVNLQPIMDLCQDAIGFVNQKTIKLSSIVQMFLDASMESDERESDGEISLFINENEEYKWIEISIDAEADIDKEECGIRFLVSTDRKKIFSFSSKSYNSKLGKVTPAKITMLDHLEHKIFRLYSAQVEIEIDGYDFDTTWSRYD